MRIKTNEFYLAKSDYFMILIGLTLRQRWFVFIFLLLFCSLGIDAGFFSALLLFILLCTVYFIYLISISWIQSNQKSDAILFAPRTCELDPDFITSNFKDGSSIKIKFDYIKRCIKQKMYYLFFYSKIQFIYLPLNSISEPKDKEALNMLLKVKSFK